MKGILLAGASLAALPGVATAQTTTAPRGQTPPVQANLPAGPVTTVPAPTAGDAGAAAMADTTPPGQSGVQDIVVTATRRAANLQTVPGTINAFQGEALKALGVNTVSAITQVSPGLVVNQLGAASNLYLRGVGTISAGFTTEPPVSVYIDGLYLPNPASTIFSFNSIERIEVLRGPQGTLYGRNTTGGLVSVVTRDPSKQTRIDASLGYGNYDTFSQNLYASTPLSDTLAANIAVTHTKQSDGWGVNVFTGNENLKREDTGVQAKLLWEPGATTKFVLRGMYVDVNSDQGAVEAVFPGAFAPDGTGYLGEYRNADRREARVTSKLYGVSLRAEQDIGFATLLSLTGYLDSKGTSEINTRASPGLPNVAQTSIYANFPGHSKTFSQELQISSKGRTAPLQYIGGVYFFSDNTTAASETYGSCAGTVCSPAPIPTRTTGFADTRSYAAYGEGTYNVTRTTHVTLGLRYTIDHKTLAGLAEPLPGRPNTPAALPATTILRAGDPYPGNPVGIDTDVTFRKVTYKAVLAQDITSAIHAFASYNRGFKSGGFNPNAFTNPASRPEVLDAFEVGVKSDLFDRVVRLNVSGFHYDYKDIQLRTTAGAPPGTSILFNAAAARVNGIDADLNVVPDRHLALNASLEYLDGKYTSFANAICTVPRPITATVLGGNASVACDNSGKRLILAPRLSYTLGATYSVDTGIGPFTLGVNDAYKSSFFWDPDNRLRQNGYHLVGASLTWADRSRRFDAQLYVRNLTGAYYAISATESSVDGYSPGAPRTYGITIGVHY